MGTLSALVLGLVLLEKLFSDLLLSQLRTISHVSRGILRSISLFLRIISLSILQFPKLLSLRALGATLTWRVLLQTYRILFQ